MKKFDLENLTIYFKGEIYNINKFVFNDVSLLLQDLYFKFGFDFVSKLDGVFAFCIYDKRKNLYFLVFQHFVSLQVQKNLFG